ncbi:hypothetical protein DITRI_Ditri11bG0093700 [Diplodiscus trichospermus]
MHLSMIGMPISPSYVMLIRLCLQRLQNFLKLSEADCWAMEEGNRRLEDGFIMGIRPTEDDLVRLQLEALLQKKPSLANENANLVRENQCLQQPVQYHQMTSQDLSASYHIRRMWLDFSSPPPIVEEKRKSTEIVMMLHIKCLMNSSRS